MKKDLKPIWIYLLTAIVGSFALGIIAGIIDYFTGSQGFTVETLSLISELLCFIIFVIIYRKMLIDSFKSLTKKDLIKILIFGVITVGGNILLGLIISEENSNQEMVEGLLNNYKILMTFVTVIVAPVVEELVLRYSFSTFIKNKWVFLAVTSILFGALHALNLNIIIYIYIGLMLGLIYLNTDKKIACPILVHLINNLASVAMLFLGL